LTLVDFFFWGAISGSIGYAFYIFVTFDKFSWSKIFMTLSGIILCGLMGGLFAVVFDNSISTSIIIGSFVFFIYTAMLKVFQGNGFLPTIREILIKLLLGK